MIQEFRLCCHCSTLFPKGIDLPPGHLYCPKCKGRATTIEYAETIEQAAEQRKKIHGFAFKIYRG